MVAARLESRDALARAGRAHAAQESASEQWVVVSVTDRGDGISPEDQNRLFQKFVRLSRSLTTSVRGTGLGLWICHQYIAAMGGDIWVESVVGEGSTFRFCLPELSAPNGAS
jgi:signal transduction histidine kinase